jgi:hypothetical protein
MIYGIIAIILFFLFGKNLNFGATVASYTAPMGQPPGTIAAIPPVAIGVQAGPGIVSTLLPVAVAQAPPSTMQTTPAATAPIRVVTETAPESSGTFFPRVSSGGTRMMSTY